MVWWGDGAIVLVSVESSAHDPHLLMYPRDHLDASSLVCAVPLGQLFAADAPTVLAADVQQSAIVCASGTRISLFRADVVGSIEGREPFRGEVTLVKHRTFSLLEAPVTALHVLPKLPARVTDQGGEKAVYWWQVH
jgi:hypothetical protein